MGCIGADDRLAGSAAGDPVELGCTLMKPQLVQISPRPVPQRVSANRRASRRFPTAQRAFIVNGDERLCVCELVDMSAGGAQVRITSANELPEMFDLLIAGDTYLKTVPVEVRWRGGDRMGVQYLSDGVCA